MGRRRAKSRLAVNLTGRRQLLRRQRPPQIHRARLRRSSPSPRYNSSAPPRPPPLNASASGAHGQRIRCPPDFLQQLLFQFLQLVMPMENLNGCKLVEEGDLCERRNGRGVDLNRNWSVDWGKKEKDYDPYEENPRAAPFSEPETQMMRKLCLSFEPHIWVNVHSGMEEEVAKEFGIPIQFQRFWLWAKRQNNTYRTHRHVKPQQEAQPIDYISSHVSWNHGHKSLVIVVTSSNSEPLGNEGKGVQ